MTMTMTMLEVIRIYGCVYHILYIHSVYANVCVYDCTCKRVYCSKEMVLFVWDLHFIEDTLFWPTCESCHITATFKT